MVSLATSCSSNICLRAHLCCSRPATAFWRPVLVSSEGGVPSSLESCCQPQTSFHQCSHSSADPQTNCYLHPACEAKNPKKEISCSVRSIGSEQNLTVWPRLHSLHIWCLDMLLLPSLGSSKPQPQLQARCPKGP